MLTVVFASRVSFRQLMGLLQWFACLVCALVR